MLFIVFTVSDAEAAAIRNAYRQCGELAAAVELRRRFPGITDNVQAREYARIIAGWKPLPKLLNPPRVRCDKGEAGLDLFAREARLPKRPG